MAATSGTIDLAQSPLVLRGERLTVIVRFPEGPAIAHLTLSTETFWSIDTIRVGLEGESGAGRTVLASEHAPWAQTIDDIAKYVAGDGTDALRVALADGIRTGKHLP